MGKKKAKQIVKFSAIALGATYAVLDVVAHHQKSGSTYQDNPSEQNPLEGKSVRFVPDNSDPENADGERGHLEATGESHGLTRHQSVYERVIKRGLDKALAFGGLVVLSPVMGGIALAIKAEDPGPVLFTQKRVGQDKQYFKLHKFRSMKMSTPHDVPTHMLDHPEQYITKVGGFIRKHSLDELPQIWDIFVGNMSVIGPRPALWNQDVLVSERDKVGANDVKPGLTGWAQINGRDELEIPEKARLDGVYTQALEQGSLAGLRMDTKCFAGSVHVFGSDDTVVEGGTGTLEHEGEGKLRDGVPAQDPEEHFGCDYTFTVDRASHKKVLIVGAGSYIGESFVTYAKENYPNNFTFRTVGTLPGDDGKSELDKLDDATLGQFDIVYHVAGIAHADVGHVDDATKENYYRVNTDLAISAARRYKEALHAARRQGLFVFMSSMIVYGDSAPYGQERVITRETKPAPANFYGDSKWQADKGVRALADDDFHVAVIRPPMIYGKGSKGNYPTLSKLAKKLPVFPDLDNQRSMLYIENLCEFLCQFMLSTVQPLTHVIVFMPQNEEYTKTSDMVALIAKASEHAINVNKALRPPVILARQIPGRIRDILNKAFGNNTYNMELSTYRGLTYAKTALSESIRRTENSPTAKIVTPENEGHTHILVISQYFYPETFRINDMAQEWVRRGYRVTVLTGIPNYPMGKFFEGYGYHSHRHEIWNGLDIIRIPLIPRGTSTAGMIANYLSFLMSGALWDALNDVHADYVFTYEVSPMTQALIGCWYAKRHQVPCYLYVQDLWPENVETITGITNNVAIAPIDAMVDYIYKNTDEIFTTSPSFVEKIVGRHVPVPREKVHFWPQYAEDFYYPMSRLDAESVIRAEGEVDERLFDRSTFKICFTGNIGYAQGLDILPRVAYLLAKRGVTDIRFVIVGDGRYQFFFEEEARKHNVDQFFIMIPRQPAERVAAYLAVCDVAFISFQNTDLFKMTIPAKLQSYMACGKPIVASAEGETAKIVMDAQCGICAPIGDAEGLANAIERLKNSESLDEMAENSRAYFKSHFDKKTLMDSFDSWFN